MSHATPSGPTAKERPIIVGLGEALFDVFPDDKRLGGAPLNVAVHAHQLGNEGIVASRIGDDELGRRVIRHLRDRQMRADFLQIDKDRKTGIVKVTLDKGEPSYEIVEGVAWDAMRFDQRFNRMAGQCDGVCFGTLGQRKFESRNTIQRFIESARKAIRLFDLNLRQDYYSRALIDRSFRLASAAKLNGDELAVVSELMDVSSETPAGTANMLRQRFELDFVAVTRGADGTIIYAREGQYEADAVAADISSGDRVGAGDSAAAALLHGRVRAWPWSRTIHLANTIGALVASSSGACPPLDDSVKRLLANEGSFEK